MGVCGIAPRKIFATTPFSLSENAPLAQNLPIEEEGTDRTKKKVLLGNLKIRLQNQFQINWYLVMKYKQDTQIDNS